MSRKRGESISVVERRWRERVEGWQRSGETQREYCRRYGLSAKSLSYWRTELQRRDGRRSIVAEPSSGSPVVRWAEVAMPPLPVIAGAVDQAKDEVGGFELVHPRGFVVRLGARFEAAALRRLLIVLEGSPC